MASYGDFIVMSDADKEAINALIINGLEVFDAPDDLLCCHCNLVPLYHYVFPCNHVYCRTCHGFYIKEKRNCRKCRTKVEEEQETKQDKRIEQMVYQLKTECDNKDYGCREKIRILDLLDHIKTCKYTKDNTFPKIYKQSDKLTEEEQRIYMRLKSESKPDLDKALDEIRAQHKVELDNVIKEMEALVQHQAELQKRLTDLAEQTAVESKKVTSSQHGLLKCDLCHSAIHGFRYHCVMCADFDLCDECEPKTHKDHLMIRIPFPLGANKEAHTLLKQLKNEEAQNNYMTISKVYDVTRTEPIRHRDVTCASCQQDVVGTRFHCLTCEASDLCERCERQQAHWSHFAIRMVSFAEPDLVGKALTPAKGIVGDLRDMYFPDSDEE